MNLGPVAPVNSDAAGHGWGWLEGCCCLLLFLQVLAEPLSQVVAVVAGGWSGGGDGGVGREDAATWLLGLQ